MHTAAALEVPMFAVCLIVIGSLAIAVLVSAAIDPAELRRDDKSTGHW